MNDNLKNRLKDRSFLLIVGCIASLISFVGLKNAGPNIFSIFLLVTSAQEYINKNPFLFFLSILCILAFDAWLPKEYSQEFGSLINLTSIIVLSLINRNLKKQLTELNDSKSK